MGLGRLPERQQLIAEPHHMGIGDVLEAQIEGIGQDTAWLLGAKHPPIYEAPGPLLGQPTLGTHETVAQVDLTGFKSEGSDHAIAVEGVVDPEAASLKPARTIAIQGARQLFWNGAPNGNYQLVTEL